MTRRTYASPIAFKQAVEDRLRASSRSGFELTRRRQLLVGCGDHVPEVELYESARVLDGSDTTPRVQVGCFSDTGLVGEAAS